jgi:hypothetical protein
MLCSEYSRLLQHYEAALRRWAQAEWSSNRNEPNTLLRVSEGIKKKKALDERAFTKALQGRALHLLGSLSRLLANGHLCPEGLATPDWLWAARRSGSESRAGRGPRWRRPADLATSQALEAKLVFLIGKRARNVGGEELLCDLTNHGSSVRTPPPGTIAGHCRWRPRLSI